MKCITCQKEKSEEQFYKKHTECKTCNRARAQKWREEHPIRARENSLRWNREHNELRALRERKRRKQNPIRTRTSNRKYFQNHPEKRGKKNAEQSHVHNLFKSALRAGKIKRSDTCEKCGQTGIIHGHHADYSKPLEVIWLCSYCHAQLHKARYSA